MWTVWAASFFVMEGYSAYYKLQPLWPTLKWQPKYPRKLPNVSWGQKLPTVENCSLRARIGSFLRDFHIPRPPPPPSLVIQPEPRVSQHPQDGLSELRIFFERSACACVGSSLCDRHTYGVSLSLISARGPPPVQRREQGMLG